MLPSHESQSSDGHIMDTQLDGMVDVILAVSIQLLAGTIFAKAFGVCQ